VGAAAAAVAAVLAAWLIAPKPAVQVPGTAVGDAGAPEAAAAEEREPVAA
jgi:hypothetical protein